MAGSGFEVTPAALRSRAGELSQLNAQYKSRVAQLESAEAALRGMWKGDANMTFQRAFTRDKVSLDKFYAVIEAYSRALETAAAKYDETEARNAAIASS